jgi:hypothetical protein
VPNLFADRAFWVPFGLVRLNVRRLMYQTLIWSAHPRDETRCLRTAVDAEDLQRAANALVDGMGRNIELDRDFLGRQMLVDQAQAIELARTQPRNPGGELGLKILWICHGKGGIRQPELLSTHTPLAGQTGPSPWCDLRQPATEGQIRSVKLALIPSGTDEIAGPWRRFIYLKLM